MKNREIWEPLIAARDARGDEITFEWVKGHSGDRMNDLVDELAVVAARPVPRARSAAPSPARRAAAASSPTCPPRSSGPSAAAATADPEGHLLLVLGLDARRARRLGRRTRSPTGPRRARARSSTAQAQLHPDLVVLTGLRRAPSCSRPRRRSLPTCPYVAVLAFPDQDRNLEAGVAARFADLVEPGRARSSSSRRRARRTRTSSARPCAAATSG